MDSSFVTSSSQDAVNAQIWAESPALERALSKMINDRGIGAQQAMPKPQHSGSFSADRPLPWVPDMVGPQFGTASPSVLIVGSSYNGFLTGYTKRRGTMSVKDYAEARNCVDHQTGLTRFFASFVRDVCGGDQAYYGRIRKVLDAATIPLENVCLTDLCKASFVRKMEADGQRMDGGDDNLIKAEMAHWQHYVLGAAKENLRIVPLPYLWLGKRIQAADIILALGKLAEYGVVKVLKRLEPEITISASKPPHVRPNHRSLSPGQDWQYTSAFSGRGVKSWLDSGDWWDITERGVSQARRLLPCLHPSAWVDQQNSVASDYGKLIQLMMGDGDDGIQPGRELHP